MNGSDENKKKKFQIEKSMKIKIFVDQLLSLMSSIYSI